MKIRLTLILGFVILVAIFFADFLINQRLSGEVVKNSTYLSHSESVIRNSDLLSKTVIDMQSGFRGYLLTGKESFLQIYNEGVQDVPPLLKEQRALVSSEMQVARLDSIGRLHSRWLTYANALITARRDTLPGASKKYAELFETKLKQEEGKHINDSIKHIFANFDWYEYGLRQKRRLTLQASIVHTRNMSILLTAISITIAVLTCVYIVWLLMVRINRMSQLANEISKGNFITITDNKNDEFRQLVQSLNTMSGVLDKNIRELTRKNKELDQFAYVVSHDLKAPLRGIDNITRWIEEDHGGELSTDVKHNIDLIKGRTRRLENMINGLLEYARIGRSRKDIQTVDVRIMLHELADILLPPSFTMNIVSDMPVFVTERLHLEQVFSNIISNAVKYHDSGNGTITVSSRTLEGFYEFSVADDGPGIDPQYHEKIFQIFQTLKERDAFESTGVGLAIVKKIIEEHKATIRVKSSTGRGAVFVFTWPKDTIA